VTAKLSREFYETFGDQIADEQVNWFNQVKRLPVGRRLQHFRLGTELEDPAHQPVGAARLEGDDDRSVGLALGVRGGEGALKLSSGCAERGQDLCKPFSVRAARIERLGQVVQLYISTVTPGEPDTLLPSALRRYFWDVDSESVSWPTWRDFIIGRLLRSGDYQAIRWLLSRIGQAELASWLRARRGGGLSPQRLRYWQLVLDLPAEEVDGWVARAKAESWGARLSR
jgi:hypothetical protein